MDASSAVEPVAHPGPPAGAEPGLHDIFRAGSEMFERPSTRRTLRLAAATAEEIAGCAIVAVYVSAKGRLARYSGREDRRLDLLVEARRGNSGALDDDDGWWFALFFHGTGKVKGAFVLHASEEPSSASVSLLLALAEPTGAALAAAELIERRRRSCDGSAGPASPPIVRWRRRSCG